MKISSGFVSNSSSSSFILDKKKLSGEQIDKIINHSEEGEKLNIMWADDAWGVHDREDTIILSTTMDNFDMHEFLTQIGALDSIIESYRD